MPQNSAKLNIFGLLRYSMCRDTQRRCRYASMWKQEKNEKNEKGKTSFAEGYL